MLKPAFTEGPWSCEIGVPYPTVFANNGRTRWVALEDASQDDENGEDSIQKAYDADATLMAASPDLYAACAEMMEFWTNPDHGDIMKVSRMVRAALAKARGEV